MGHANGTHGNEDVFDELTNVESRFYAEGWQSGYDHGRLHGLFEGRELGREKGWEIWEEVGFYEGWAGFYQAMLSRKGVVEGGRGKESRALNHAKILLDLISKFPSSNPSDSATTTITPSTDLDSGDMELDEPVPARQGTDGETVEVDLPALLSSIRARYRLLCSSLGARPRLATASNKDGQDENNGYAGANGAEIQGGVVQGIEGPMRGVDTRQLNF